LLGSLALLFTCVMSGASSTQRAAPALAGVVLRIHQAYGPPPSAIVTKSQQPIRNMSRSGISVAIVMMSHDPRVFEYPVDQDSSGDRHVDATRFALLKADVGSSTPFARIRARRY
jgi:hypothetical protein